MNAVAFDFRQPPAGSLEGKVAGWLTEACKLALPQWASLLPTAKLAVGKVESVTVATWLRRLPDQCIGMSIAAGADDGRWLFAIPRAVYLAMIVSSLGEALTALPTDRVPTTIEDALGEYLVRQLILWPFQEAWPSPNLELSIAERGLPRKVCTLPPNDVAAAASLKIEAPFGSQTIEVLLPRSGLVQELLHFTGRASHANNEQSQMESLVREMATPLSVDLGSADVTMSRFHSLAEGDLLILSQRVTEPLTAKIGDAAKYRVWPGTVGNRQAVRVESTITTVKLQEDAHERHRAADSTKPERDGTGRRV